MKVVTIKHPPPALEGLPPDSLGIGEIYDLSPQLALWMIAAGWVRNDTRTLMRRQRDLTTRSNRRQLADRRSATAA